MTGPEDKVVSSPERSGPEVAQPPQGASGEQQLAPGVPEAQTASAPPIEDPLPNHNGETLVQSLLSIIVIVLFVITFIVQAFQIPSKSMENTLLVGDYLLVDKVHYGEGRGWRWLMPYKDIARGDIIVFRYPVDPHLHFVKRVVGIPGDRVHLYRGTVFVNGKAVDDSGFAVHKSGEVDSYRDNFPAGSYISPEVNSGWWVEMRNVVHQGDIVVPPDRYFVLGDNRDDSLDSRYWG